MHAMNTYLLQDCFVSDEIVFYIYVIYDDHYL